MTTTMTELSFTPDMTDPANSTNATFASAYPYPTNASQLADPVHGDDGDSDITQISVLCIKSFIFGSIIIGAVLGNALVILAVRRNRKLR
jgi:hypothetical protein